MRTNGQEGPGRVTGFSVSGLPFQSCALYQIIKVNRRREALGYIERGCRVRQWACHGEGLVKILQGQFLCAHTRICYTTLGRLIT